MNYLTSKLFTKNILQCKAIKFLNNIRNKSGCMDDKSKCAKLKIRKNTCKENAPQKPPTKKPAKIPFKSMWELPRCSKELCKCPPVKFDDLYYKVSDKGKRKYQQTWISCPARKVVQKTVCEFPKAKYPPLKRRPKKERPDTAKCLSAKKMDVMDCGKYGETKQNKNCIKITLPGCRGVRSNVKCKLIRDLADCKIVRPPYPSFSECTHPKIRKKRPSECECLKIRSMCEVWTILRQKKVLT